MKYASHRCRHGQKEEDGFFERIWKKHVRYFDRRLPELVGGVFRDAGRCNFKNGFEWFLKMISLFKKSSFNYWIFYCIQQSKGIRFQRYIGVGNLPSKIIHCVPFDPIDPHFSIRIVPVVPWIGSFQEIATNGNIENQVEIAIKRLS